MTTRNAAIYARISRDDRNDEAGVRRQEQDCRDLAARLGYSVAAVFVDNDRGASTRSKKTRPAYAEMLQRTRSGEFGALLAYSTSRLTRRPRESEDLIELVERGGVTIKTVVSGDYRLDTADGRAVARTLAAWDAAEAERTAERVSRAALQRATDGASYHGQTPFGYVRAEVEKDGRRVRMLVPDPVEAPLVREAYRRLLDGDSLWAIARDFTSRGVVGKRGNPFRGNVLGNLLRRPVYAGLRAYKGEVLGGGEWEPLVSKEDHARALAILDAPGRFHLHGTAPKYLLSGIARCGRKECGGFLRPRLQKGRAPSLVCYDCTKVTRKMAPLDEYVVETVLRRLEGMELDLAEPEDGSAFAEAVAERDAVQTRMDELADSIASGALPVRIAERSAAKLDEKLATAEARIRSLAPRPDVLDAVGAGAREAWAAADLERRRTLLRTLVDVRVDPSGPGVPFHADQVRITWLDEKPEDPEPTNS